jgi:hypothetical protein
MAIAALLQDIRIGDLVAVDDGLELFNARVVALDWAQDVVVLEAIGDLDDALVPSWVGDLEVARLSR